MAQKIGIIDYEMGNVGSLMNAIKYLGEQPTLTADPSQLESMDKLLLPGVGAFGDGMKNIKEKGLDKVLNQLVLEKKKPILGICLGMQLLCSKSFEFGKHQGLDWIPASVVPLNLDSDYKIPHMGWNNIRVVKENPLVQIGANDDYYFIHSFYVECSNEKYALAKCNYGNDFACIIGKDNIYGTQFHPEKSQKAGLTLLTNFINL